MQYIVFALIFYIVPYFIITTLFVNGYKHLIFHGWFVKASDFHMWNTMQLVSHPPVAGITKCFALDDTIC